MCALNSSRLVPKYHCGQQDLYTIVETGWGSFAQYLPEFESQSTLYSATTRTNQLAALAAARSMPGEYVRSEVHMTLRIQLVGLAEGCIIKWSCMSSYIRDGFPKEEYTNKRLAAGHGFYAGAEHEDWDDVKGLMQAGLNFANGNSVALTTGGMPATFIADLEGVKDAFELKHQAFLQAEEDAKTLTDEKVAANNALYRNLMKMFEDGKRIFRHNAAVREQFTFDRVWALVRGSGGTRSGVPSTVIEIGAIIFDELSLLPIDGATLRILNAPGGVVLSVRSDFEGLLMMNVQGFDANETVMMQFEVMATGYETEVGEMEMTAGNLYSLEVPLNGVIVA